MSNFQQYHFSASPIARSFNRPAKKLALSAIAAALLTLGAGSALAQQPCEALTSVAVSLAIQTSSTGCATGNIASISALLPLLSGAYAGTAPNPADISAARAAFPQFASNDTASAAYPQFVNLVGLNLNLNSTPGSASVSVWVSGVLINISSTTAYSASVGPSGQQDLVNTMTLQIPLLGVNKTLQASGLSPQKANGDAMQVYLNSVMPAGWQSTLYSTIMNWQAQNTVTNPITGATGLIPAAIATDFNANFTQVATNVAAGPSVASQATKSGVTPNLIGAGLEYTDMKIGDTKVTSYSIPLSYTIRNDIDPRRQLVINLPITYSDNGQGGRTGSAGLGLAYRVPMNDNWTLTPSGKYSAVIDDADVPTAASAWNLSLTSTYIFPGDSYDIAIGNMLSYSKTGKLTINNVSADPNVSYWLMRNGIMLSQPMTIAGHKLAVEYSLIDMRYIGSDKPLLDNIQEIGITVGTNKNAFSARSFIRGGLSYVTGKDTKGFRLNIGYWF